LAFLWYTVMAYTKGVRDIFSGLVGLPFLFSGQRRSVAWVMLTATIIPIADGLIMMKPLGSRTVHVGADFLSFSIPGTQVKHMFSVLPSENRQRAGCCNEFPEGKPGRRSIAYFISPFEEFVFRFPGTAQSGAEKANTLPGGRNSAEPFAPSRARRLRSLGAKRKPLTEEAHGLGAGFCQVGQSEGRMTAEPKNRKGTAPGPNPALTL
jgi:hypothetical protein